jgi:hypothetical protein
MREGGWSREVTARELPASKTIAGVNLRLTAGGVRELPFTGEPLREQAARTSLLYFDRL